ncbi:MAG: gfo/Idh/MocA family oxidoreductase [Planctomycetia bacterium]|nr:gfo/Idh/MocA family oxidoreductase [Planctomycetia bacterium]
MSGSGGTPGFEVFGSHLMGLRRKGACSGFGGASRRGFLGAAAAAIGVPAIVPSSALGLDGHLPPSERIAVGMIGTGARGSELLRAMAPLRDHQVVALADCRRDRLELAGRLANGAEEARGGKGSCDLHDDFRELIDRRDVDAVFGVVPDHWHGPVFARVLEAGKDLYGEKPLTRSIAEGVEICRMVRRHARVFQTGTQQRSWPQFRLACELARNGTLGKVREIEVAVPGGVAYAAAEPCPPPAGFDYDMWTGPAPLIPYDPRRCEWLAMYMISHYCAGFITNWGVHHLDIATWGCPEVAQQPFEVEGTGMMPSSGMTDTWIEWQMKFRWPSGLRLSFSSANKPHPMGCRFIGDEGWVRVDRSGIWAEPQALLGVAFKPADRRLYASPAYADPVTAHIADFFRSVRTRIDPAAPVEVGHASSTLGNVCDIALRLGRKVRWDPASGGFVDDDAANAMRSRPRRATKYDI